MERPFTVSTPELGTSQQIHSLLPGAQNKSLQGVPSKLILPLAYRQTDSTVPEAILELPAVTLILV